MKAALLVMKAALLVQMDYFHLPFMKPMTPNLAFRRSQLTGVALTSPFGVPCSHPV